MDPDGSPPVPAIGGTLWLVAAPDFVPTQPTDKVRTYSSPPSRNRSWMAQRPGDLTGEQPSGERFGTPGPDQGYSLKLAKLFDDRLKVGDLNKADVVAGCVAVANKRSALYGRAPVVHDLTAAFTIWGFLDESPDPELVELRERLFPQVASSHHYPERREIVDLVPADALRRPHAEIVTDYQTGWRQNLSV